MYFRVIHVKRYEKVDGANFGLTPQYFLLPVYMRWHYRTEQDGSLISDVSDRSV